MNKRILIVGGISLIIFILSSYAGFVILSGAIVVVTIFLGLVLPKDREKTKKKHEGQKK